VGRSPRNAFSWLPAADSAINAEAEKVAGRAWEQIRELGLTQQRRPDGRYVVGDSVTDVESGLHGQVVEVVYSPDRGGLLGYWIDFAEGAFFRRPPQLAPAPGVVTRLLPAPSRYAQGGIVGDLPKPLVCDCGHPDSVHSKVPGRGCTHRPYCLCVHPTGQRVPRTRVRP